MFSLEYKMDYLYLRIARTGKCSVELSPEIVISGEVKSEEVNSEK